MRIVTIIHKYIDIHIYWSYEDNPTCPSSSLPQWLCSDMPAMTASGGVHALLVIEPTECSTSTKQGA